MSLLHQIVNLSLVLIRKFRKHFIFANSVKRHICDVKNSRLGHDQPVSVNDRLIFPFREDFIFTKLRIYEVSENKTLAKISVLTVLLLLDPPQ